MLVFGFFSGSVWVLILFGLIGFGIQGGFVGMYSMAAKVYQTEVRATGVGWAVGAGRIGAIIGPFLGGVILASGVGLSGSFAIFTVPAIIAGIATLMVKR